MQARENLNGDRVHWTQNKGYTRLQEEGLATLPKSEGGGDKTLLTQCVHIYGAICSVSMGSADTFYSNQYGGLAWTKLPFGP